MRMIYNGIVTKLSGKLYLFILDPDNDTMTDGMNISEHKCYKNLENNQLWVVEVEFCDGTLTLEKIDLDEYIYGDKYGDNNIFLHIKDIQLFTYEKDNGEIFSMENDVIRGGKFNDLSLELINKAKELRNT